MNRKYILSICIRLFHTTPFIIIQARRKKNELILYYYRFVLMLMRQVFWTHVKYSISFDQNKNEQQFFRSEVCISKWFNLIEFLFTFPFIIFNLTYYFRFFISIIQTKRYLLKYYCDNMGFSLANPIFNPLIQIIPNKTKRIRKESKMKKKNK